MLSDSSPFLFRLSPPGRPAPYTPACDHDTWSRGLRDQCRFVYATCPGRFSLKEIMALLDGAHPCRGAGGTSL